MLDLLPAEILLAIIDTPEVYQLISQVVTLGDDFTRSVKYKFALLAHKRRFSCVLADIDAIEYNCPSSSNSIRYLGTNTCYCSGNNTLEIMTKKHILLEPRNWIITDNGHRIRHTDSYNIEIPISNGASIIVLNGQKRPTDNGSIEVAGWASCYVEPARSLWIIRALLSKQF